MELNLSRTPVLREQYQPLPLVVADGGAVTALSADVDTLNDFTAQFAALGDYVDDAAAAVGGVAVGDLYRNGSAVMIRVS